MVEGREFLIVEVLDSQRDLGGGYRGGDEVDGKNEADGDQGFHGGVEDSVRAAAFCPREVRGCPREQPGPAGTTKLPSPELLLGFDQAATGRRRLQGSVCNPWTKVGFSAWLRGWARKRAGGPFDGGCKAQHVEWEPGAICTTRGRIGTGYAEGHSLRRFLNHDDEFPTNCRSGWRAPLQVHLPQGSKRR